MTDEKIHQLEDLVSYHLGKDEKITAYQTNRLTAVGDNYGSLMLSLKISVENEKNGEKRILETIAKLIPRNEFVQKLFNVQATFKNELGFYGEIVPTLEKFLKDNQVDENIDFVAQFYGGRINLGTENGTVDENAVIILENLKHSSYFNANRIEGFDLPTARFIIKLLARFHATSIALKSKHPKIFEEKIKPHLTDYKTDDNMMEMTVNLVTHVLTEDPDTTKYVEAAKRSLKPSNKIVHERWASIMHNDLWVNNIMIKQENGRTTHVKLVDFQVCEYKSVLRDLIFFLFSSLSIEILQDNLDNLIDLYYNTYLEILKKFKIDVAEFSLEDFEEQLKFDARESEYYHVIFMLFPILVEKPMDISEMDPNKDMKDLPPPPISEKHKEKMKYVTKTFAERGWLE